MLPFRFISSGKDHPCIHEDTSASYMVNSAGVYSAIKKKAKNNVFLLQVSSYCKMKCNNKMPIYFYL